MSYAVQRKDGAETNKLYSDDAGIHDWYRFVLSYPPHLVREYIQRFGITDRHMILDPFAGTGTTLVESKKNGIPSVGIEANPVVQMAARAKVNWDIDSNALLAHSASIAKKAQERLSLFGDNLFTLDSDRARLIIKDSIGRIPLHKSLVLLSVMDDMNDDLFKDIERTAFAKQLVYSYSNLHFGPEVGVSRKRKKDADVVNLWTQQIEVMAHDLMMHASQKHVYSKMCGGDARSMNGLLDAKSIDAVITSPPYPNEKDYTRTTRLESVLLGFTRDKSGLRESKQNLLRSNTRNIYKQDEDEKWILENARVMELADAIERKRIELEKTSGFERMYCKVVKNYFGGMAKHLEELKQVLRPGAQLAYVVGDQASYFQIPIKTGSILAEIAVELGYELVGIDLFRTRFSTATRSQLREEVVLLRWGN